MKKIVLVLLVLMFTLTSCDDKTDDSIGDNDFLEIKEDKVFTENTYYLDLVLDDDNQKLFVTGSIVYVNDEMDLDELYIKIYPNAHNISDSTYNVNMEYLRINDMDYDIVYSGNDNTTIHLDLEETLSIGETFQIDFKYDFTYWDIDRLAKYGNVYYTMFFYPFVAMYDEGTGWQLDDYAFRGESYYNEIGDYFVSLVVPDGYKVAPSGKVLESISESDDNTRYNIYLEDGRDFSFSTSPIYHVYSEEINGITQTIYSIRPLTDTEEYDSFQYLRHAFDTYEDYIGDYYYDYFNLEYGYIYGMESSGVVYCSEDISEYTVVHEIIHQWFYSMIGNDQSNFSFIDESLTTYTTYLYFKERYGVEWSDGYLDYRSSLRPDLSDRWTQYQGVSLLQKVPEFGDGYGYIIYYHGPTIFRHYVDEYLDGSDQVLKTFLNTLYDQYHGKEVPLDEFLQLLEDTTGVENTVEWFTLQINSLGDLERTP